MFVKHKNDKQKQRYAFIYCDNALINSDQFLKYCFNGIGNLDNICGQFGKNLVKMKASYK